MKDEINQRHQRLETALNELIAEGKPFTLRDWAVRAEVPPTSIYMENYLDLLRRATEAKDSLTPKKQPKKLPATPKPADIDPIPESKSATAADLPDPTYTALQSELMAARQRIAELESAKATEPAPFVQRLTQLRQELTRRIERIEAGKVELEADLKAAIIKLRSIDEILELETGDRPTAEFTLIATSNGNGVALCR